MQNKKKVYLIISIVSFSIVLAALAAIGGLLLAYKRQSDNYEQLAAAARTAAPAAPTTPATEAVEETQPVETAPPLPTVEIPINFDYLKGENEDIIESSRELARRIIADYGCIDGSEWQNLKNRIKDELHRYIFEKIKRNPMILPIIMEI